ncbi:LysM peptidoglycan-binding domain-containing protein, partial [Streptococcus pneumoniae]
MKKRMLLASTVALSFAPVLATQAEEVLWTARSVEQIQNDLTKTDNKTSYTVQYGDTLSTIAEALGVDVTVLANLNKITNMDLIFPETVLTTTVNEAEEVTEVEIQTPQADSSEEVTTATADLTTNQVTVDDQTVQVADLSQPIAEAPKEVASSSEVTKTVIASEEVAPSTGTSVPEEQTAETSSAVAEEAPQETTPAEKQETQTSPQAASAVEATTTSSEAKEVASSNGATAA